MKIFPIDLTLFSKAYESSLRFIAICKVLYISLRGTIQVIQRQRAEKKFQRKLTGLQDILHLPLTRCVRAHYQLSYAQSKADVSAAMSSLYGLLAVEHGEAESRQTVNSVLKLYGHIALVRIYRRQMIQHQRKFKDGIPARQKLKERNLPRTGKTGTAT
jgi:hypothetical protein